MKRTYMVVFERVADDNWGAWAPDIGGAVGAGDSLQLARHSLLEGISIQLQDLTERGLDLPAALARGVDFSEFDPDPARSHYEIEWLTVDLPEQTEHKDDRAQQAA